MLGMPSDAQPVSGGRSQLDRRVFARIDEIHAAVLQWRDELQGGAGDSDTPGAVRKQVIRAPQIDQIVTGNLAALRASCRAETLECAQEDEWAAGSLTKLELIWKAAMNVWPPDPATPVVAAATLRSVAASMDQMVYICAGLRIAPRINDTLKNLDPGQPLDVEFEFGTEFPRDPELRKRLLLEVAQERNVLQSGLVDVGSGVVYRLREQSDRWKSYVWPLALVLFGGGLVAVLPRLTAAIPSLQVEPAEKLLAGYGAWVAGAFLHLLIQALRQSRTPSTPAFAAMDDWLTWMCVKERAILSGTVWVILGYLFAAFLPIGKDPATMLFAGYSADSMTDVFVQRFEATVAAVSKTIVDTVTPPAEPPKAKGAAA
jgi:hypothetical protein